MAWYGGMVWYGMVWYGMVDVCEGAPVAVSGWVLTDAPIGTTFVRTCSLTLSLPNWERATEAHSRRVAEWQSGVWLWHRWVH